MSSTSFPSSQPSQPALRPFELKPQSAKNFQSTAEKLDVTAVYIAKEALKDKAKGLIGVKLGDKKIAYYEPADYRKIVDEQVKTVLALKRDVLKSAISSLEKPKDIKDRLQEISQLKKDVDISKKLRNSPNKDIRTLISEIDELRNVLVLNLVKQNEDELELMSAFLKPPLDQSDKGADISGSGTVVVDKAVAPAKAVAAPVSSRSWIDWTALAKRISNFAIGVWAAVKQFFSEQLPFNKAIKATRKSTLDDLFLSSVLDKVERVVKGAAAEKEQLAKISTRAKEGNAVFNDELRKQCNERCDKLFIELQKAEKTSRESPDITEIPISAELHRNIEHTKAMLESLKLSSKNCLKKTKAPAEQEALREVILNTETALHQINNWVAEKNLELRIDKAPTAAALLKVVQSIPSELHEMVSPMEFEAALRGIKNDVAELEAEADLIKNSIKAVEKEVGSLKQPADVARYQPILNLLRNQLQEVQQLRMNVLKPIVEPVKDAIRSKTLRERPDIRQEAMKFVAQEEALKESAKALKITVEQLQERLDGAEVPAKPNFVKDLEHNPFFNDVLDEIVALNINKSKESEQPAAAPPHTASERDRARMNAMRPFEQIRAILGITKNELANELRNWNTDPNALLILSARSTGETKTVQSAIVERSSYEAVQKQIQSKKILVPYELQPLTVDQYMAFRTSPQSTLVISSSQEKLKSADERIEFFHARELACYAYVKNKLGDSTLSAKERTFLEKDFLQLEKNLSMPRYASMETHLSQMLEIMHKYEDQFAFKLMLTPKPNLELDTQGLELRSNVIDALDLVERAYNHELKKSTLSTSEKGTIAAKMQTLEQVRNLFNSSYAGNKMIPNRFNEIAAEFAKNSTIEQWPTVLHAKLFIDVLGARIKAYNKIIPQAIAQANQLAESIKKDPSLSGISKNMMTSVPNDLVQLPRRLTEAKAHLEALMPRIVERDETAFIKAFIQANGNTIYCNRDTGEYSTTAKTDAIWYPFESAEAQGRMLAIVYQYADRGLFDLSVTKELLNSNVIANYVPIDELTKRKLQEAVATREFAHAYHEAATTGKPMWQQKVGDVFTYVCSADVPKGKEWVEIPAWKATQDAIHLFNEKVIISEWDDNNPLTHDLWNMADTIAQSRPEYEAFSSTNFAALQERVAVIEQGGVNYDSTRAAEARLKEIFTLTLLIKKFASQNDLGPIQNEVLGHLNRLLAIADQTAEFIAVREASLAEDLRTYPKNRLALGIYVDLSDKFVGIQMNRNVKYDEKSTGAVFLPMETGKSSNWPEANLQQMKNILRDPLNGIVLAPALPKELREELNRSRCLAAYIAVEKFLASPKTTEADKIYLRERRSEIKNLLMNEVNLNKSHQPLAARVAPMPATTTGPVPEPVKGAASPKKAVAPTEAPAPVSIATVKENDDIAFSDAFIKANGGDIWRNERTGAYSSEKPDGSGWNKIPQGIIAGHMREIISHYANGGFSDLQNALFFAYDKVIAGAAPGLGMLRPLEAMRESIEVREFSHFFAQSLQTGEPLWKLTHNSAGVDLIRYESNSKKPPKGNWKQMTPMQTKLDTLRFFHLHADPRQRGNNLYVQDLWKVSDAVLAHYKQYEGADLSKIGVLIQEKIQSFKKPEAALDTPEKVEERITEILVLQSLLLKAAKFNQVGANQFEQLMENLDSLVDSALMQNRVLSKKTEDAALQLEDIDLQVGGEKPKISPEQMQKWKEGVLKREQQYREFVQNLKGKTPKELLDYVRNNRVKLGLEFENARDTIGDLINMSGLTINSMLYDTPVTLVETLSQLKTFLKELKKLAKSEDVAQLVQRFLSNPDSFNSFEPQPLTQVDAGKRSMLLGEKAAREGSLKILVEDMANLFEQVKELEIYDLRDINKYSSLKSEYSDYLEHAKNYKPQDFTTEVAEAFERLKNGIAKELDTKSEEYRRRAGLPIERGHYKDVRTNNKKALAEKHAAEKIKAAQNKPPELGAAELMKSIETKLLKPLKNFNTLIPQLQQLKNSLKNKDLKFTKKQIQDFRNACDNFLQNGSNQLESRDYNSLKFHINETLLSIILIKPIQEAVIPAVKTVPALQILEDLKFLILKSKKSAVDIRAKMELLITTLQKEANALTPEQITSFQEDYRASKDKDTTGALKSVDDTYKKLERAFQNIQ